jgi:hypothetical protein
MIIYKLYLSPSPPGDGVTGVAREDPSNLFTVT